LNQDFHFYRQFRSILKRASVKKGTFYDFRRTALSNWFANGMSEHDVMVLAGHSNFDTSCWLFAFSLYLISYSLSHIFIDFDYVIAGINRVTFGITIHTIMSTTS